MNVTIKSIATSNCQPLVQYFIALRRTCYKSNSEKLGSTNRVANRLETWWWNTVNKAIGEKLGIPLTRGTRPAIFTNIKAQTRRAARDLATCMQLPAKYWFLPCMLMFNSKSWQFIIFRSFKYRQFAANFIASLKVVCIHGTDWIILPFDTETDTDYFHNSGMI